MKLLTVVLFTMSLMLAGCAHKGHQHDQGKGHAEMSCCKEKKGECKDGKCAMKHKECKKCDHKNGKTACKDGKCKLKKGDCKSCKA